MSIICTVYVPEGIVMTADSRMSVNMNIVPKDKPNEAVTHIFPASDNTQKVMLLSKIQAGISVSGLSVFDEMTAADFLRNFEKKQVSTEDGIYEIADKLAKCTAKYGKAATFHVAGFDADEPFFYSVTNGEFKRLNCKGTEIQYGVTWSGEVNTIQKLMMSEPAPSMNFKVFPISDAVSFADFLLDTSIKMQNFEMKPKTCGGPIDILVLTKDGAVWKRHKLFNDDFIPMPGYQKSGNRIYDEKGNAIN